MTDEEIVRGYVENLRESHEDDSRKHHEFFWAWEAVTNLIDDDPERAWSILLKAIAACPPETESIVGAGPLEELLVKYPRQFAERVAAEILRNDRFELAFRTVYLSTEFASLEDAEFFNETLRTRGVSAELITDWRIADPHEAV